MLITNCILFRYCSYKGNLATMREIKLVLTVITAMFVSTLLAQTSGQMKVVKPTEIDTPVIKACYAKVIDTIEWQGTRHYLLDNYVWDRQDLQLICRDTNYANGHFASYAKFQNDTTKINVYTTRVNETYKLVKNVIVERKNFNPDGNLGYLYQKIDSCKCSEEVWFSGNIRYYSYLYKDGQRTKLHYYRNGMVRREINFLPGTYTELSALEYNVWGDLIYKYNCQNLTRIALNADGSVKEVTKIKHCNFRPGFSDGW